MSTPLEQYLAKQPRGTARALAEASGLSVTKLCRVRRGYRAPSIDEAARIEAATGGAVPISAWVSPSSAEAAE